MPPMRVSSSLASEEQLERVRGLCASPGRGRMAAIIAVCLVAGGAAAAGGVWMAGHHFLGVLVGLAGCGLLARGVFGLLELWAMAGSGREAERALERVRREGVQRVEIEAARAFSAVGADEDVPAVVLVDGHGGGVYINSGHLDECEAAGGTAEGKVPARVVMVIAAGWIVEFEAGGEVVAVEDGPGGSPVDEAVEAAVVRMEGAPAKWARVMRG